MGNLTGSGCIIKAPCGEETAAESQADRGKLGTKRSVLTDSQGIPLGRFAAPANRHKSPLLRPTLEKLSRFGIRRPPCIWMSDRTAPRPASYLPNPAGKGDHRQR